MKKYDNLLVFVVLASASISVRTWQNVDQSFNCKPLVSSLIVASASPLNENAQHATYLTVRKHNAD